MAKDLEISNIEKKFIFDLLASSQRLDGRKSLLEQRNLNIVITPNKFGDIYIEYKRLDGSIATRLHCKVTSEVVKPKAQRPFEGTFFINCEFNGLAGLNFENYKVGSNSDEFYYGRLIESMILRSNALDLEQLCIIAGLKVWNIRVDVHVLEFDGGFLELASIGCMTSLLHYRRPDVTVRNEKVTVHSFDEKEGVKLGVLHIPIALQFNLFQLKETAEIIKSNSSIENNELVALDCTLKEDLLKDGEFIIALNKNREIVQLNKPGGLPIAALKLIQFAHMALPIIEEITSKMLKAIEIDERQRNKYGHLLSAENDRYAG
ncbi:hypothetical protein QEN19_001584 [Hanseniaspora menglaensis]